MGSKKKAEMIGPDQLVQINVPKTLLDDYDQIIFCVLKYKSRTEELVSHIREVVLKYKGLI